MHIFQKINSLNHQYPDDQTSEIFMFKLKIVQLLDNKNFKIQKSIPITTASTLVNK